jgi:pilus assembly protein Flp/PilA
MFKYASTAIVKSARRFVQNEAGATSIEYAMIASGVAVVIATAVTTLGTKVNGLFTSVSTSLK